jgi:hypothetical protein
LAERRSVIRHCSPSSSCRALPAGGFAPGQEVDVAGANRVVGDGEDHPEAVGEIGIAAERDARRVDPRDPDPFDVADAAYGLCGGALR